ncbi:MAG: diacylglycerol kinase family lipid kinase [Euryarchaeota archaeon]|nr:diacylglycerol kinase family lipid kinase [Euryarchaeota archaeon]MDE1835993.1 diacylglycerol kinase family lipid kinase [Euryarchaeota archaeon]MDE1880965.1 diacylglycerol kinase family lipid kinase [Euryarchaeota archaeon]MDE2046015.1 diacylglycerol kinase family lipid kinase [Thermoplasmata archaeon]
MSSSSTPGTETPPPPQRVYVVLNPRAGGGKGEERWKELELPLKTRFPVLTVLRTTRPQEEAELGRRSVREGADLIIAAGGDGTLSGVVDGVLSEPPPTNRSTPPVAVLPVGTGSDFARGLELPRDPAQEVPRIASGPPRRLDVGRLTFPGETPPRVRHFVNQSYVGFGAKVVRRVNEKKGARSEGAYTRAVFPELVHHRPLLIELKGVGAPQGSFGLSNLVVAIGRYSGGGMLSSPNSDPADGIFDMIAVGPTSRGRLLSNLSKFRTGRHLTLKDVIVWKGTTLEVEAKDGRPEEHLVEADGDIVGRLPVRYEILPRALTFWG